MAVYLIADVKVTDDSWMPDYAAKVHDIVHKHGGKYLSRSANIKTIEGAGLDTTIIALLEFPTMESLQAFVDDPDYARSRRPARMEPSAGSTSSTTPMQPGRSPIFRRASVRLSGPASRFSRGDGGADEVRQP
jgi:uncharacterized protein (DUF1330 family)